MREYDDEPELDHPNGQWSTEQEVAASITDTILGADIKISRAGETLIAERLDGGSEMATARVIVAFRRAAGHLGYKARFRQGAIPPARWTGGLGLELSELALSLDDINAHTIK